MSTFTGETLRLTLFGASHAPEVGMVLEGIPAGSRIDRDGLRRFLARRAPGRNAWQTARREADEPVFQSGIIDAPVPVSDGSPIRVIIRNQDARSSDYEAIRFTPRPGHADYTAFVKYGGSVNMAGGGPFSGRMTAPLCVAGGICLQLLEREGIRVISRIASVGAVPDEGTLAEPTAEKPFPTVSDACGSAMVRAIERAKEDGDSLGGIVECAVTGLPAGLGGPLFDGMEGRIASLAFAIPAVKGIEFGAGFSAARMTGSEANDAFAVAEEAGKTAAEDGLPSESETASPAPRIRTKTNNAGGILGGITNGMPLTFRVAIKPTPSIAKEQETVDLRTMTGVTIRVPGRHDPCIVPRAVPAVEAAAAIAVCDALLAFRKERESGFAETDPASAPDNGTGDELSLQRRRIDAIDERLTALFRERMAVSETIAAYKNRKGIPVRDPKREEELLARAASRVPEELREDVRCLYETILERSRNAQERRIVRSSGETDASTGGDGAGCGEADE